MEVASAGAHDDVIDRRPVFQQEVPKRNLQEYLRIRPAGAQCPYRGIARVADSTATRTIGVRLAPALSRHCRSSGLADNDCKKRGVRLTRELQCTAKKAPWRRE